MSETNLSRRAFCTAAAALPLVPVLAWKPCEPDWYIGQDWRELNRVAFRRPSGGYDAAEFLRAAIEVQGRVNGDWFCGAHPQSLLCLVVNWERGQSFDTMRVRFTDEGMRAVSYWVRTTDGEAIVRKEVFYGVADFARIFDGWEMVGYLERER